MNLDLITKFLTKHGFCPENLEIVSESVLFVDDYYFSPEDAYFDVNSEQSEKLFCEWYDKIVGGKTNLNFKEYCKNENN